MAFYVYLKNTVKKHLYRLQNSSKTFFFVLYIYIFFYIQLYNTSILKVERQKSVKWKHIYQDFWYAHPHWMRALSYLEINSFHNFGEEFIN